MKSMVLKKSSLFFIVLSLSLCFLFKMSSASTLEDKKAKLDDIRLELEDKKAKLEEANAKEEEISYQIKEKKNLLYDCQDRIRETEKVLTIKEKALKSLKNELAKKEKNFFKHQKELEERLQNIYENVDPATLSALTEAENFSDFLKTFYYLQIIVEDDFSLLNRLKAEKLEITRKKVAIENNYNKVLTLKKDLRKEENSLYKLVDEQKYLLACINDERKKYSDKVIQLEDTSAEIEKQIQGIIDGQPSCETYYSNPSHSYGGSLSLWPASGPVTSSFGWRIHPIYGSWRFHSGVDIAADYGAPIVAPGDGVVICSEWIGGYGNAVMVDHGGGVVSLYGHCESLLVQYGQHVTKGQVIATVGSTGNSTGPHLHFEVRQDGVSVDPTGYFK